MASELRGGATVAGYPIWHGGSLQKSEFATANHQHVIGDISSLQTALNGKASTNHDHDSTYFTQTVLSSTSGATKIGVTAISGVSGTNVQSVLSSLKGLIDSHNHDTDYYKKTQLSTNGQSNVHWGNLTNVPTTFTPSSHNHNDLYYTKSQLGSTTSGSSGAGLVGVSAISGVTGADVQTVLGSLKNLIDGKASSSHSHSDYLKSAGDRMTGTLSIDGGGKLLQLNAGNNDGYLRFSYNESTDYCFDLKYTGSESAVNNSLELWAGNQTGTPLKSFRVQQDGIFRVVQGLEVSGEEIVGERKQVKTNTYGNSYDADKQIYKVVEHKRSNGTLKFKSTLSNPDSSGNYRSLLLQFYNEAGTSIIETQTWTLTYNSDGKIISKVIA